MVYVGQFNEQEVKSKADKKAIKKTADETGLKYTLSKIVYNGKKPIGIKVWCCSFDEYAENENF